MMFKTSALTVPLLFALAAVAWSQNELAGITGTVQDAQGRPISGAVVRLQQDETKLIRVTRTGSAGSYFLGGLPIGAYSALISIPGFDEARVPGIRLSVGQTRTLDV